MFDLKVPNLTVDEIHILAEKLRAYGEYVKHLEDSKLITIINAFYYIDPHTNVTDYVKYSNKCDNKDEVVKIVESIIQRSIDIENEYVDSIKELSRKNRSKWWYRLFTFLGL